MKRPIRGVILDIDGTLVDSNDAHAQAYVEAFAEAGHDIPFARLRALIGMGGDKLMPSASGISLESPPGRSINKRKGEIFKAKFLPELRAFPSARALLQRMRHGG